MLYYKIHDEGSEGEGEGEEEEEEGITRGFFFWGSTSVVVMVELRERGEDSRVEAVLTFDALVIGGEKDGGEGVAGDENEGEEEGEEEEELEEEEEEMEWVGVEGRARRRAILAYNLEKSIGLLT